MAKNARITRHRSAKTGEYVTKEYADRHPLTTIKETKKSRLFKLNHLERDGF